MDISKLGTITVNGREFVAKHELVMDVRNTPEYQLLKGLATYLINEINDVQESAQAIYDDVRQQGLTFNTIEAEGYLRAMNDIVNLVKYAREDVFPNTGV